MSIDGRYYFQIGYHLESARLVTKKIGTDGIGFYEVFILCRIASHRNKAALDMMLIPPFPTYVVGNLLFDRF